MKRNGAAVLIFLVLVGLFLFHEPRLAAPGPSPKRARNLVLFVGDGMGLSTINAASIYGHQRSRALFIQSLPHLGLSDTSTADEWVSDSAAGMTALMTGSKTLNGVISQGPQGAVRGKKDGPVLKTLLEYAEERGLSTGLVTNDEITGATPAACYAHVNDRGKKTEIALQLLAPRFGDGVDVLVGVGRESFLPRIAGGERNDGRDLIAEMRTRGYHYARTPEEFLAVQPNKDGKVLALFAGLYEPEAAVEKAISLLSRNPRGYFLMVEWNSHWSSARETLDNTLRLDRSARRSPGPNRSPPDAAGGDCRPFLRPALDGGQNRRRRAVARADRRPPYGRGSDGGRRRPRGRADPRLPLQYRCVSCDEGCAGLVSVNVPRFALAHCVSPLRLLVEWWRLRRRRQTRRARGAKCNLLSRQELPSPTLC